LAGKEIQREPHANRDGRTDQSIDPDQAHPDPVAFDEHEYKRGQEDQKEIVGQ
jgi:hypothetical protein